MSGIYLHIPFCKQACYYCDFHFSTSIKKKKELVECLQKEILLRKKELSSKKIETIYFGGGTPSLLSLQEINSLLETIYTHFNVVRDAEITLEANPDDLTLEKVNLLADSKINRLSIGIQTFNDQHLRDMNRAHNSTDARMCLEYATDFFDNITIDLIYGIPNMSDDEWRENLQTVFDFNIPHISSYALTVEEKTALESFIKKEKYPPIDENKAKQHFDILIEETQKEGFVQYEISNFGKPDFFSKHNSSYWKGKEYLGIGPSAHSYVKGVRSWNVSNNSLYIKSIKTCLLPSEKEELSNEDRFNELVMTGLRTVWGVSVTDVENQFGEEFKNYLLSESELFVQRELMKLETVKGETFLKITNEGKFLADGIASDLFIVK